MYLSLKVFSNPSAAFTSSIIYVIVRSPASILSVKFIVPVKSTSSYNTTLGVPNLSILNSVPLITFESSFYLILFICKGIVMSGALVNVKVTVETLSITVFSAVNTKSTLFSLIVTVSF